MINMSIEFAHKMSLAYSATCKTLCRELKLPQTAFDILMFLANNPDYKTASDIVEVRKIRRTLSLSMLRSWCGMDTLRGKQWRVIGEKSS